MGGDIICNLAFLQSTRTSYSCRFLISFLYCDALQRQAVSSGAPGYWGGGCPNHAASTQESAPPHSLCIIICWRSSFFPLGAHEDVEITFHHLDPASTPSGRTALGSHRSQLGGGGTHERLGLTATQRGEGGRGLWEGNYIDVKGLSGGGYAKQAREVEQHFPGFLPTTSQ